MPHMLNVTTLDEATRVSWVIEELDAIAQRPSLKTPRPRKFKARNPRRPKHARQGD